MNHENQPPNLGDQQPYAPQPYAQQPYPIQQPFAPLQMSAVEIAPVAPVKDFLWPKFILLIPFVGPIAYVILIFVRAFGSNTNPNLRNHARSQLLLALICSAVLVVISILFGSIFTLVFNELRYL